MGAGSHKIVYKAWDNSDGKLVAWNVVSLVNLSVADQERLKAEVQILRQLSHPRLIHFVDNWNTDTAVVFITAIVGSGDLRRHAAAAFAPPAVVLVLFLLLFSDAAAPTVAVPAAVCCCCCCSYCMMLLR